MTGCILIADDMSSRRILLAATLRQAHYTVGVASTPDDLPNMARDESTDLILLDARFGGQAGPEICRMLKSDPTCRGKPVILLTSPEDETLGLAALEAGADEFLAKPIDTVTLLARVRSLLRARTTQDALDRRRVTVEDLGFAEPPARFEAPAVIATVIASGPANLAMGPIANAQVVELAPDDAVRAEHGQPLADLFLIDAHLDGLRSGLRLLSDLRSRASTRHAAMIVRHPVGDADAAAMALDLGANDIVCERASMAELSLRIRTQLGRKRDADRLRASVETGLRLAVVDPLTGLYNRRYALTHLTRMAEDASRTGKDYALMVADIDRFKAVNDRFGHAIGDAVLVETARRLRDNVRDVDLVARLGGEEFLVAMPDTTTEAAAGAAERLRRLVSEVPVRVEGGPPITVTISIGLTLGGAEIRSATPVHALIERADRAMYGAKSEGRNQIVVAGPG